MISKEFGQRLYREIESAARSQDTLVHRVHDLRKTLERIIDELTMLEVDAPLAFFEQIGFLQDRHGVPAQIVNYMHAVRKLGNRASHSAKPSRGLHAQRQDEPLTETDYLTGLRAICALIR
jgi:hypothetical protein